MIVFKPASRFVQLRLGFQVMLAALLFSVLGSAQGLVGVHPRAPADYAISGQLNGATFAASVLSADQVKHIFAIDISKSYVVMEVACFPAHGGTLDIHPDDFLVKAGTKGEFVHPADGVTVASVIQRKNSPAPPSSHQVVRTEAALGYSTGTDEYGRRVHSVYTETGVAVGPDPNQAPYPSAGGSGPDYEILEQQLMERGLGEGRTAAPVAGYLYFPASSIKKSGPEPYQLQYFGEGGQKLELPVRVKSH